MAAACAGGGDRCGRGGFAGFGEEGEFADFHGEVVAICCVAETAGHAAAAGVEDAEFVAGDSAEHVGTAVCAPEGFLVTVAVQEDG